MSSNPAAKPNYFDSLELSQIESDCWQLLAESSQDANADWRLPVLANSAPQIRQRTIVLRKVSVRSRLLFAHTDVRSHKVRQFRQDADASLLFYDATRRVQLHVTGSVEVQQTGSMTEQLWNAADTSSLRGYLAPIAPGEPTSEPCVNLPHEFVDAVPSRDQLEQGRENFCVLEFQVASMEWLMLRRNGHLRALFQFRGNESPQRSWLAP